MKGISKVMSYREPVANRPYVANFWRLSICQFISTGIGSASTVRSLVAFRIPLMRKMVPRELWPGMRRSHDLAMG